MPEWVTVARLVRPRGLKGEIVADTENWAPEDLLAFPSLVLKPADRQVKLESAWRQKDRLVLKIAGIDSVEQAEKLRGAQLIALAAERPPVPEGEFYLDDLRGCLVIDSQTGLELGTVEDCMEYGGPVLLQVMCEGRELLIPFASTICKEIDMVQRRIVVDLPEGLKEL